MKTDFSQIKAGDVVWLGSTGEPKRVPRVVAKVTPTQIVLDGNDWRYYRSNGVAIGTALYRVTGRATPEEAEAWRDEQRRRAEEADRQLQVKRARQAKRAELNALFGQHAVVRASDGDGEGDWMVTVYGSEDDMRRIAEALRDIAT